MSRSYIVDLTIVKGKNKIHKSVQVQLPEKYYDLERAKPTIIGKAIKLLQKSKDYNINQPWDKNIIVEEIKEDVDFDIEVDKDDIYFTVVPFNFDRSKYKDQSAMSFKEAEKFLQMIWRRTGYMPQYGDVIDNDQNCDRFVIVAKDFALDDYDQIYLNVIPEEVFWQGIPVPLIPKYFTRY